MFTQGFISGFALISPWALQECRAYGTRKEEVFAILNSEALALVLRHLFPQTLEATLIIVRSNKLNGVPATLTLSL